MCLNFQDFNPILHRLLKPYFDRLSDFPLNLFRPEDKHFLGNNKSLVQAMYLNITCAGICPNGLRCLNAWAAQCICLNLRASTYSNGTLCWLILISFNLSSSHALPNLILIIQIHSIIKSRYSDLIALRKLFTILFNLPSSYSVVYSMLFQL